MKRFLVLLSLIAGMKSYGQTVITFKDSTYQVIDRIYNDDFPTPTHCFSFGAGGLWHARFYFEHYTQSNSILYANIAGRVPLGSTKPNALAATVDFIQNFTPLKFERNISVATGFRRNTVYVAKVPTKVNVKAGLRASTLLSFYADNFEYRNQHMYGTNAVHAGVGVNITIARYTHLIMKEQETGAARETRLFFIPTYPVLMQFDSADAGWTTMKMKTVNEYYGYPSKWGWRAGIEYKHLTAFGYKNYIIGINAYFIVDQNQYYSPRLFDNSPSSRQRRGQRFFTVGFGYSFMKKATHFDDIKFSNSTGTASY